MQQKKLYKKTIIIRFFPPSIQLTWHDGSGSEITEGVEQTKELLSDGKRYTVKSTLKLQVQSEHHNTTLACHATNAADKATKIADIKLEVIVSTYFK